MAAALNVKPQPLSVDLSSYGLPQTCLPTIHPAFLRLVDFQKNYQSYDLHSLDSTVIRTDDVTFGQVSSARSDSDTQSSPSSIRENVIVKNETKKKKELVKDEAYWERRKRNNDAAKRSRDTRRQKEDELAARAAILEQENQRLKDELDKLRLETDQLRTLLMTSPLLHGFALNIPAMPAPVIIKNTNCRSLFPDSTQRGTVINAYNSPT